MMRKALGFIIAAFYLFGVIDLSGAPGDLDGTFGSGGRLTGPTGSGTGVVLQADGKIVVALTDYRTFSVARYTADGSPDVTFGDAGRVTTSFGSDEAGAMSVAIQRDGKIVAAGWKCPCPDEGSDSFVLVRYNQDGSLDTSLDGDGVVTTKLGLWPTGYSVAVQADEKIVVGGFTWGVVGNYGNDQFALARYNPDGSLDSTFDGDGKVTTKQNVCGICNDDLQSIALQPDGKIVAVGGGFGLTVNTQFEVVRYNTDGSLDTNFAYHPASITPVGAGGWFSAAAVQTDGKILVAGVSWNGSLLLARLNSDGSLDKTFDSDGMVTTQGLYGAYVAVQPNGKIVLVGTGSNAFKIIRYDPNGSLDMTFGGGDAETTVDFHDSRVWSIALDRAGRAVVAGSSDGNLALARLLLEPQFSVSGRVTNPNGQGLRNAVVSLIDSSGARRTTSTSAFGFYTFDQVLAGSSYTIAVASRRYTFAPRTLAVTDNITGIDLVGQE